MIRRAPWALFVQLFTLIGTWYLIEKFFPCRSAGLKRVVFNLAAKESTSTSARSYTSWSNQAFGPPYCAGSQVFTSPICSLHIMKCSLNTLNAGWGKSDMSPLEGKTENRSIHHHKILHRQHSPHQHTSSTYAFVLSKVLGRIFPLDPFSREWHEEHVYSFGSFRSHTAQPYCDSKIVIRTRLSWSQPASIK